MLIGVCRVLIPPRRRQRRPRPRQLSRRQLRQTQHNDDPDDPQQGPQREPLPTGTVFGLVDGARDTTLQTNQDEDPKERGHRDTSAYRKKNAKPVPQKVANVNATVLTNDCQSAFVMPGAPLAAASALQQLVAVPPLRSLL